MLSWIQKSALLTLLRQDSATIKQMRPSDVEANLFTYHLDRLRGEGYIEKIGRGSYRLTTRGQRLVGAISTETNQAKEYMKTVIVLYAKDDNDRYLLFRWSRQPYLNKVGLLHDHMPLGRTLDDSLRIATTDKLGQAWPTAYRQTIIVRIMHGTELVTHMTALVYEVSLAGLSIPFTSRNGTALLAHPDELSDGMEGLQELLEAITTISGPHEFTLSY